MDLRIWNRLGRMAPLPGLVIALAMSLTPARAADDGNSGSGKLEGAWFTQVSIRDCNSGAVLRTFVSLNVFVPGGTSTDTTAGVPPALRSPGIGTWRKAGGLTYDAISMAFTFSPAGAWTGTQKLTHKIELKDDTINFTSTVQFFDANGTVTATGCATAVGNRI